MISFLSGLLFAINVICALCLIGIILIQQSKSGGGLGAISGGMTESVFGAAAGNVITKTTVALASVFLVCTLLLALLSKYEPATESVSDKLKQKEQVAEGAAENLPDEEAVEEDVVLEEDGDVVKDNEKAEDEATE